MIKNILTPFIFILSIATAYSQTVADAEKAVVEFFEAFHEQDTVKLRQFLHDDIAMQTIMIDQAGELVLNSDTGEAFLNSIASIPPDVEFEERLLEKRTQVDGNLANVWTPYRLYVNGQLYHCGANSFHMMYTHDKWVIFQLVDTRRKDCD